MTDTTTGVSGVREALANYYHVYSGTTEIAEHGGLGGGSAPTLKGAKEMARHNHEWTGEAQVVFKGEKVYLRIPENPEHKPPNFQVMPPLSEEEYQALKESIAERGLDYPINKTTNGTTVDGHHRERAIKELEAEGREIPYGTSKRHQYVGVTVEEARDMAWKLNMHRRHLDRDQKRELIKTKLKETPEWSDRRIAKFLGVSPTTVGSARFELKARGELKPTVQSGHLDKRVGADGKERALPTKAEARAIIREQEKKLASKRASESEQGPRGHATEERAKATDEVVVEEGRRRARNTHPPQEEAWSNEERALLEQLRNGETVVANLREKEGHPNLIEWAKAAGLFVRVDRQTPWGNPFTLDDGDRDTIVRYYREFYFPYKTSLHAKREELKGKVLSCWCAPAKCHAHALKAWVEGDYTVEKE